MRDIQIKHLSVCCIRTSQLKITNVNFNGRIILLIKTQSIKKVFSPLVFSFFFTINTRILLVWGRALKNKLTINF